MSATSLARKRNETFDAVEETNSAEVSIVHRVASDEEVNAASSYILAEHIEAYKELAKYDAN
jgi:hypothetical protein